MGILYQSFYAEPGSTVQVSAQEQAIQTEEKPDASPSMGEASGFYTECQFRWLLGHRTCAPPSTIGLLQKVYFL